MSDPIFDSHYLAEQPRRALLSEAKNRLKERSGDAGPAGEPVDSSHVVDMGPRCGLVFWIQDGDRKHPLIFGVNTIGRMQDNVVVLDNMHVSRHHCAIIVHRNGNCEVQDIASKNGTILNGKALLEPTPIRPGDVLSLSNHEIVLHAALAGVDEETPMPEG